MKTKLKRRLVEEVSFGGGLKVDRQKGVIYGVKILGFDSQNGRKYLPEAVKNSKVLYEGVLVNIDHPKEDPSDQRSAYDRFGKLVNVRYVEGKGLYGDLVYLTTHPMAKRVVEAAERMPEAFGMSHNAQGEGEKKDGIFVVHAISEVRHVDLVADPATTKSLSEGVVVSKKSVRQSKTRNSSVKKKLAEAEYKEQDDEEGDHEDYELDKRDLKDMILDILDGEGETKDKAEAIEALMKEQDDKDSMEAEEKDSKEEVEEAEDSEKKETKEEEEETKEEEDGKATESKVSRLSKKLKALQEQVDRGNREKKIRELCESVDLNPTKDLVEDLMSMPNDVAARHAKRLAIAYKATKPKSGIPTLESRDEKFPSGLDLGAYLSN